MSQILFYEPNKPYYEFSNFANYSITIDNVTWRTVEQYFQAQKFYKPESARHMEYYNIIHSADAPTKVFMLGRQKKKGGYAAKWCVNKNTDPRYVNNVIDEYKDLEIREDWDDHKLAIMKTALLAKFTQNIKLKSLLLSTGDAEIIEDSPRDPFWGRPGNNLGRLLMEIRTLI